MVKRKSVYSSWIVAFVAFFFVSPLDDILFTSVAIKFLFHLSWLDSVIFGAVIGVIVFVVLEFVVFRD